jgi:hypothetical protein
MMCPDGKNGSDQRTPREEPEVQPALAREAYRAGDSGGQQTLFSRFWEEVAPFNNYSPEAARALLARESRAIRHAPQDETASDPLAAVHAALSERAAGRKITRNA